MFIQIYLGTCYQYIQIVSKNILHIRMYVKCWAFYKKKHLIIQLNQHLIQVESIYSTILWYRVYLYLILANKIVFKVGELRIKREIAVCNQITVTS